MDRLSFFARLVRVLGPAVSLQAAELLVIFFCPGPRYFRGSRGCRRRSEHEQEVQEEIQERTIAQRKEIPGPVLECEALGVPDVPGSSCAASLPLSSASISTLLVHDGAGNIGLLDARLTNIGVRHGLFERGSIASLVSPVTMP